MTMMLAILVGWLFATGTYLVLQRALTRIVLGLGLLTHGSILLLITMGGRAGRAPIVPKGDDGAGIAAPLPQAFALTAIVIGFGVSAFLLALSYRSWVGTTDDEVQDDVEDRQIARMAEEAELARESEAREERWDEWDDEPADRDEEAQR